MKTTMKIDRSKIEIPRINFTQMAINELKLIIENDFTLAGKYFRLLISGKGCEGFTYSAGFTDIFEEDFLLKINSLSNSPLDATTDLTTDELFVIVDPFAAFYLSEVTVDFVLDPVKDMEGFIIENHLQKEFQGKFFNKDLSKLPPMIERENSHVGL
jgi:Fe-S cluster assembly iron-binding protein IscA